MIVRFRFPSILDVPAISAIRKEAFPMLETDESKVMLKVLLYSGTSLVGVHNGRVISYCLGEMRGDSLHIMELAVRRAYRGKGVGKLTLRTMEKLARKRGAKRITLEVAVSNEVALSLYEKEGYVKKNLLRGYYPWGEDAYLMVKVL